MVRTKAHLHTEIVYKAEVIAFKLKHNKLNTLP